MNYLLLTVALIIAAPVISYGQAQNNKSPGSVERQLIKLENEWLRAGAQRDEAAIKRLLAVDWTNTSSRGRVIDRAQLLNGMRSNEPGNVVSTISDMQVRVYGKLAIVTGLYTTKGPVVVTNAKGTVLGEELTLQERFTNVWMKNKVGWQCIASHYSFVQTAVPQ